MDAPSKENPFDNVEPHCHLPANAKAAFWAACELVLARPGDFTDALAWLEDGYSEVAMRERLLRKSEGKYRLQRLHLWQGVDRCDAFPRRMALRAGRPELEPSRRLALLQTFYSVPELAHIPPEFIVDLSKYPEKVRDWVVQLTIHTALSRGWRIEGDKVATSNATIEKNFVDAGNVEVVWRWQDEQCRESIRHIKKERRERDAEHREQAKERGGRLRQAAMDVVEMGLPAGKDEHTLARRIVLVACLLSYQHNLTLPGEFCDWQY